MKNKDLIVAHLKKVRSYETNSARTFEEIKGEKALFYFAKYILPHPYFKVDEILHLFPKKIRERLPISLDGQSTTGLVGDNRIQKNNDVTLLSNGRHRFYGFKGNITEISEKEVTIVIEGCSDIAIKSLNAKVTIICDSGSRFRITSHSSEIIIENKSRYECVVMPLGYEKNTIHYIEKGNILIDQFLGQKIEEV